MLFNIFISYINNGTELTLSKFADDAKLCGTVDTPEGQDALERELDSLELWAQENLMRLNKAKYKVLHPSHSNPHYQYKLCDRRIEHCPVEKNLGTVRWT